MTNNDDFSLDSSAVTLRYKVVVVGDVSVGKSSLIARLTENKFRDEYEPSIGVDFASKSIKYKDRFFKMQIWDTAGQEKYKSLIPSYIRGSNIIIVVFDITCKSSYDNVSMWIDFINKVVPHANIFIVANKYDLSSLRKISTTQCEELSKKTGFRVFEVSAKTGESVSKMFYTAISTLSAFEAYVGEVNALVKQLEDENSGIDNKSYFSNTNKDIINLDTGKAKISDSISFSKEAANKLSLKIEDNRVTDYNHEFPKKECKC